MFLKNTGRGLSSSCIVSSGISSLFVGGVIVIIIIALLFKCSLAFGNLVLIIIAKKFMEV